MKTEIKIAAIAYDVELVDLRTGDHVTDRIVLDRSWLDVLNKVNISDRDFIQQSYSQKGYLLLTMTTKKKVSLTVDMNKLYAEQGGGAGDAE